MGVIVVDGSTVRDFVNDAVAFEKSIGARFSALDLNGDGVLSRSELRNALETFRLTEADFGVDVVTSPDELTALYDSIFDQFDVDRSGTVDLEEFRVEMRQILLAVADGLGSAPIQIAVEDGDRDSFIQQAADLEAEKMAAAAAEKVE